jgi:hypothetical protein
VEPAAPRLTRRTAWTTHIENLPILEGTLIRLDVGRLPSGAIPTPAWLWHSRTDLDPAQVDLLWQAFLRRFDIEHTRAAKDTGLTNLPLHELNQNKIWCAIVALACELTAWAQMLGLTEHPARRWEPKRLRLRLLSIAGRLARTGRRTILHLAAHAPWAPLLAEAITSLRARAAPG